MTEKLKNSENPTTLKISPILFVFIWSSGTVAAWYVLTLISNLLPAIAFTNWMDRLLLGGIIGASVTLTQVIALRLGRGVWSWGWALVSMLGWAMSGFLFEQVITFSNFQSVPFTDIAIILSFILMPTLLQMVILRRWVRQVWLWALSIFASATATAAIFGTIRDAIGFTTSGIHATSISFGAYGLITAITFLWLFFNNPKEAVKEAEAHNTQRLESATATLADTPLSSSSTMSEEDLVQHDDQTASQKGRNI